MSPKAYLVALFATILAACATPSVAQAPPPAERYVLDGAHTQVTFSVSRFGFTHIFGRFDNVAGVVMLDQAHPENSSVTATIQTASISSGDATRDEHLRGTRWFDAAQFPTMQFHSSSVRLTGERTADIVGDLTLHGVTNPVTLSVTLNQIGRNPADGSQAAGFSATGTVSRAQFGMNTAPQLIGDEVRINIEALGGAATPPAQ